MANEVRGSVSLATLDTSHLKASANLARTQLASNSLQNHTLNLADLCKWDDLSTKLPAAATSTYLGLVNGTFGSAPPTLQTGDCKVSTTTRRGRILLALPDRFPAGGNISIKAIAGMKTTVSDTTATILVEAYQLVDDGTVGSLLTSATPVTINSLTLSTSNWTVTTTGLNPGDRLDVRVSIAIVDGATGTAVIGLIQSLVFRCDCQP